MCGIAGMVGELEHGVAVNTVKKMVDALVRRGPDDEGVEIWDRAVLGHRRLAIFDLTSAGRQPMFSADHSIGVVFNGAIYNYRELRQKLIHQGCCFVSKTDTEVLIHGYRAWGLDNLVAALRGMFAFGLWDDAARTLYLVRDRLGVKPLVFTTWHKSLAFASTARALRSGALVGEFDEKSVYEFLHFGFVPDERAIYRNVVKVSAGSVVEWRDGIVKTREYWAPPIFQGSSIGDFDEVVEETERLLLDAVAARLHADVPVGALISGGIDSSLVCWAIKQLGGDVTAYTVAVPGDSWDESKAAGETAQLLGIEHRVLPMSDRDALNIDELITAYAEPFACASALGMLRISEAVSPSVKVLLTGDGGDDIFLGYPEHRHLWLAAKLSGVLPRSLKSMWRTSGCAFPRIGPLRRVGALFDYTAGQLDAFFGYGKDSRYRGTTMLGERLSSLPDNHPQTPERQLSISDQDIQRYLDYARRTRFVSEYMTKVDGATMHHALEARSPFLDHKLWEFAASLPFDVRLHRGQLKAILRELAKRKIGPLVARRRKRGFGIPVQRWMVGRWLPEVESAFNDSILDKEGWIRSDCVLSELHASTRRGWAAQELWYLFVLESWMKWETNNSRYLN